MTTVMPCVGKEYGADDFAGDLWAQIGRCEREGELGTAHAGGLLRWIWRPVIFVWGGRIAKPALGLRPAVGRQPLIELTHPGCDVVRVRSPLDDGKLSWPAVVRTSRTDCAGKFRPAPPAKATAKNGERRICRHSADTKPRASRATAPDARSGWGRGASGGRTRARTWDPLIKSYNLQTAAKP